MKTQLNIKNIKSKKILILFLALPLSLNITGNISKEEKQIFANENTVIVNDDIIIMYENNSININILNNDYGLDSGIKSLKITTAPTNGSATIATDNSILYTPTFNYTGSDLIEYEVCNNYESCGTGKITITVSSFDFTPQANNDTISFTFKETPLFKILENDQYLYDIPITVTIISDFAYGQSVVTSDMEIESTFGSLFSGSDVLTYQVCDADGDCSTAKLFTSSQISSDISTPQGFSPDGDGINETFYIPDLENLDNVSITILTRNGAVVYKDNNFKHWDGISNSGASKGKKLETGVYYYTLKANDFNKTITGYIYLSR